MNDLLLLLNEFLVVIFQFLNNFIAAYYYIIFIFVALAVFLAMLRYIIVSTRTAVR